MKGKKSYRYRFYEDFEKNFLKKILENVINWIQRPSNR